MTILPIMNELEITCLKEEVKERKGRCPGRLEMKQSMDVNAAC